MPKKAINSFNAGELSPYLYARSDLDKYQSGCLVMENFTPLPYGGATRRPAIEFINASKQDDKIRMIPFSASSATSYAIEAGEEYMRFYKDGALVETTFSAWSDDTELQQQYGWLRTYSGSYYRCVENHFAGEFDDALEAGEWEATEDWDTAVSYVVNDIVVYEGSIYISIQAGSAKIPDAQPAYWTAVSPSIFAVDTVYAQYDVVEYKDDFYWAVTGYTSAGFSEDLSSGYWIVTTSADLAYEIPTAYAASDLLDIKFAESIDVMWFAHPDYPTQRLSRLGDAEWTIADEAFDYPPLLDENDTDIEMTPSASSGDITITSSEDYFDADMVGGTIQLTYDRSMQSLAASGSLADNTEVSDEYDVSGITWGVEIEASGDRRGGYVERKIGAGSWTTIYTFNGDGTGEYDQTTAEGSDTLVRFSSAKIKGCAWSLFYGNTLSISDTLGVPASDFYTAALNVSFSNWEATTSGAGGTWIGLVEVEKSPNGQDQWEKYVTVIDTTGFDITANGSFSTDEPEGASTWVRIKYTSDKAGNNVRVNLHATDPKFDGLATITGYTSATEVSATVTSVFGGGGATTEWSDGAFSAYRGYPKSIALFENRLCYAGTSNDPNTIWMSVIDDYGNFRLGDLDTDGLKLTLNSGHIDDIRWMVPQERLVIGTAGSEWSLGASDERKAITPTGFNLKRKTTYGSNDVQAILVNSAVLFLMRQSRKVREWTPNYNIQDYVAPDLSILAEHITEGGVVQWDYQQQPDNVLWSIRADGTLLGFTYERDQNVTGWHRHNNDNFTFESIAIIPRDNEEDELWVSVKQGTKRLIGRLNDREWGTDYLTEWQGSDLYVAYSAPATATLTGLDHLNGLDVVVVGDGVVEATEKTVTGGEITVDSDEYTTVVVGLPFSSTLAPLYLNIENQYGTSKGGKVSNREAQLHFKDTFSAQVGQTVDDLEDAKFDPDETALYSGIVPTWFDNASDWLLTTYIKQEDPMPCTVIAMIPNVEVN